MSKVQEFLQVRAGLIGTILWVLLFAVGLAKTIWEHEWTFALFCGVFLGIGVVRLVRVLRPPRSAPL